MTPGTNLKFYTSVAKGLKLKFRKFWGLLPTFEEVTGENLVERPFCPSSPPILNKVKKIHSSADLEENNIDDIEKYYGIIDRLLELFLVVENALDDGDISVEFKDFMLEDLDSAYTPSFLN